MYEKRYAWMAKILDEECRRIAREYEKKNKVELHPVDVSFLLGRDLATKRIKIDIPSPIKFDNHMMPIIDLGMGVNEKKKRKR